MFTQNLSTQHLLSIIIISVKVSIVFMNDQQWLCILIPHACL